MAYEATHYRAGTGPSAFVLRLGQHSPELMSLYRDIDANCALFITAFNPFGQARSNEENEVDHALLGELLWDLSNEVIEGEGADPTDRWHAERSYLALGIGADVARELGHRFKQDAVVWVGDDAVPKLLLLR